MKPVIDGMIRDIFKLRIKALKWIIENDGLNLSEMIHEVYPQIERLKEEPKLEVLAENLLFALRINKKVVDALLRSGTLNKEDLELSPSIITYDHFITSIALGVPDETIAQKIITWTSSSLYIEFILVASVIISDEKINPNEDVIDELAFLVADAAQEYSAVATELGVLKSRSSEKSFPQSPFDNDFINEQKQIADLGLNDFNETLNDQ